MHNHTTIKGEIKIFTDNGNGIFAHVRTTWYTLCEDQQFWNKSKYQQQLSDLTVTNGLEHQLTLRGGKITWKREELSETAKDFVRNWKL